MTPRGGRNWHALMVAVMAFAGGTIASSLSDGEFLCISKRNLFIVSGMLGLWSRFSGQLWRPKP